MTGRGAAAFVALVLLAAACGSSPTGGPPTPTDGQAPASATFHEGGLTMDYPAGWREFHYQVVSSFSDVIAYLGNTDVQDPCTRTANSISCGQGFHLPPDSIVVVVEHDGFPGYDILDPAQQQQGVLGEVAGLPARVLLSGADAGSGADQVLTWRLSAPGFVDNYYTVTAYVRGPDAVALLGQANAMVKSLRYDTAVVPLPSDPAAIRAAVGAAIDQAAHGSTGWDCIPRGPGVVHAMITAIPNGPELPAPVPATCTVSVEATAHQLWKVSIHVVAEGALASNFGDVSPVLWVAPLAPGESPSPTPSS